MDALLRAEARGIFLDESLDEIFRQSGLSPRDRRLATEIAYGTTRLRGRIDHVLRTYIDEGLESVPHLVLHILRTAAYQLIHLSRVPGYAVVHEAVQLTRAMGCGGLAGLVNAVLRGLVRGGRPVTFPAWNDDPIGHLSVVHSHPRHLVETWLERWPVDKVHEFCRFNNTRASLYGRINPLRSEQCADHAPNFLAEGRPSAAFGIPGCFKLHLEGDPAGWECVSRGYVTIQDPAAMLVAPLLSVSPGLRVWDVCGAPGGKCTHCAELMQDQGHLVASDISPRRLTLVEENRKRLELTCIDLVAADGLRPPWIEEGRLFDAILLDVPCTGWGIFRRHPDLRWRLSPDDPARLGRQALDLLVSASRFLAPGGVLVYATCTLSHEENEDVVIRFLADSEGWRLERVTPWLPDSFHKMVADQGWLTVFPSDAQTDGLFVARLRRGAERRVNSVP